MKMESELNDNIVIPDPIKKMPKEKVKKEIQRIEKENSQQKEANIECDCRILEIGDEQINIDEISEKCKTLYKKKMHKAVKTFQIYFKISERKAYYVINGSCGENNYIEF